MFQVLEYSGYPVASLDTLNCCSSWTCIPPRGDVRREYLYVQNDVETLAHSHLADVVMPLPVVSSFIVLAQSLSNTINYWPPLGTGSQ